MDDTLIDTLDIPEEVQAAVNHYIEPFLLNMERTLGLVQLYQDVPTENRLPAHDDMLRAAVVFAHATLEELLRELALALLPHAQESTLNGIPLAGSSGRAEKFALGKLAQHRGKTVDQLIEQSVRDHLETSNFNSVEEIVHLLQRLEIDSPAASTFYPALAQMMERRHQIVHRADVRRTSGGGRDPRPVSALEVLLWMQAVASFGKHVSTPALIQLLQKRGLASPPIAVP